MIEVWRKLINTEETRDYLTEAKQLFSNGLDGFTCKYACNLPEGSRESVRTILCTGTFCDFCATKSDVKKIYQDYFRGKTQDKK